MSLKSIRDNYSKLLEALNESGVKFDASQKSALDGFIMALESTASEQRKQAATMAKQMTEAKLEKEYKQVFESVIKHMQEHYELAGKIQDKVTMLKESKKISEKVENYLDLYAESVCPKKVVVDYAKMKKLEQINESLRDVLLANDDAVIEKKAQLDESFKREKGKLETEVAKMQVKLNESMEKTQQLKKKLNQYKALELLESKTKDLPSFEANKIKKHFATASAPEIEKNFKKVLESVKKDVKKAAKEAETTLESEVNKIVNEEEEFDESRAYPDLIKDRNSATSCIERHRNDLTDFANQDPKPTKDQLVDFVVNIFKEDGLDTPWTRQFILKMQNYTRGFDDALQYVFNAYLKGRGLSMDAGKNPWKSKATQAPTDKFVGERDEDEDFETTETITYNENGEIELGEEDVINESTMRRWCNMSLEVR